MFFSVPPFPESFEIYQNIYGTKSRKVFAPAAHHGTDHPGKDAEDREEAKEDREPEVHRDQVMGGHGQPHLAQNQLFAHSIKTCVHSLTEEAATPAELMATQV